MLGRSIATKFSLARELFQNLIGMLGSLKYPKAGQSKEHVSKPYRYARKERQKWRFFFIHIVSKPYRYARKLLFFMLQKFLPQVFQNLIGMLGRNKKPLTET